MGKINKLRALREVLSVPQEREYQDEFGCRVLELISPYRDEPIVIQIIENSEQLERIRRSERAGTGSDGGTLQEIKGRNL
jgi:hypothetical protein